MFLNSRSGPIEIFVVNGPEQDGGVYGNNQEMDHLQLRHADNMAPVAMNTINSMGIYDDYQLHSSRSGELSLETDYKTVPALASMVSGTPLQNSGHGRHTLSSSRHGHVNNSTSPGDS
jgi:hypothetical protein